MLWSRNERKYRNITGVVRDSLCTGCGVCAGICPVGAITMVVRNSVYVPQVNGEICRNEKGCSLCIRVCPGHKVEICLMAKSLYPEAQKDSLIGAYTALYTGYACDHEIRYHSASGGVVTALCCYLLDKKHITGVLVTRMHSFLPLQPEVFIARTREEILQARSSKYCPVAAGVALQEIINSKGKYAVVGLPCHIHGIRKSAAIIKSLANKIKWYFGLYCSSSKSFNCTEFFLYHYGISKSEIESFAYRDNGCLGNMRVETKQGSVIKPLYKEYYPLSRSFFNPYRCTLCMDHTAELADIGFGDIHIPEYWDDTVGIGSIVVRSEQSQSLLVEAQNMGVINLLPLKRELLVKSQADMLASKKRHVPMRMKILRFAGLRLPVYDYSSQKFKLSKNIKIVKSVIILYTEIFIGRLKWAWPVIRFINSMIHKT